MTVQEFHDAKLNDEESRYIIAANMKSFVELQSSTEKLMKNSLI